ncbi:aldehyde reductase [Pyrenochaeta sp. DS3sAY3a]|nr:aldehyde reductase [Pyrenochaeta sp. DS3sAY3a]
MGTLKLENLAIPLGSWVVVTGCSGFIGSHVADQVLAAGFNVRGTSRDSRQTAWLKDYFSHKYGRDRFDLVSVPDSTASNAFDEVTKGVTGFIHVAHDMAGSRDPADAIQHAVKSAINALKSSTAAGLKRFVYTSSSFAVTQPKPSVRFSVDETTFNEEAIRQVETLGKECDGETIYSAAKVNAERALQKWKDDNNSSVVINCVNPNANIGLVLQPQHQGYPTSAAWVKNLWDRKYETMNKRAPEHYIDVQDDAKLHVIALVHPGLSGRRLLGMAASAPISAISAILKEIYPDREFDHIVDEGTNECVNSEADRVEGLLWKAYGHGYTSLKDSVKSNAQDLV